MDQNKVGKYIKKLRLKKRLSQTELAKKLSITKQAISKWENGRGLPDIEMLKQLSNVFEVNVDDLLNGGAKEISKTKRNFIITLVIIILIISVILFFRLIGHNNFEFNSIASDNDSFSIKGVMAYNNEKKSIYISDIIYSASDSMEEEYVVAECILYEKDENSEKKLSQCGDINNHKEFNDEDADTLSNLLKDIEFNIDNYSCSCNRKNCNNLYLRINAVNIDNKIVTYNIPIQVNNNCKN